MNFKSQPLDFNALLLANIGDIQGPVGLFDDLMAEVNPIELSTDGWNVLPCLAHRAESLNKETVQAIAEILAGYGADVNCVDRDGYSPLLHCANQFGEMPELAEKLLELGACPNKIGKDGLNFLSLVAKNSSQNSTHRALSLMLKYGFDIRLLSIKDIVKHLGVRYLV